MRSARYDARSEQRRALELLASAPARRYRSDHAPHRFKAEMPAGLVPAGVASTELQHLFHSDRTEPFEIRTRVPSNRSSTNPSNCSL
jgi:hypothetical protein